MINRPPVASSTILNQINTFLGKVWGWFQLSVMQFHGNSQISVCAPCNLQLVFGLACAYMWLALCMALSYLHSK